MLKVVVVCLLLGLVLADVHVHIELNSDSFARGDELIVNWRISTEKPVLSFLRWGTPLEGEWNSNMFLIQDEDNNIAEYQGRIFKRAAPQLTDYHLLTPKSALEGSLTLSEGYKFYNKGTFSVTLRIYLSLITGETMLLESNTVSVTVTNPDRYMPVSFFHTLDVGFTDCSASEKNVVNAAIPAATTASNGASAYMNQTGTTPSCDSTYVNWFGTYTSSRWNKVKTDFAKIHSRLQSRQFNINCGCKQPGTYAYVYPSDPTHTIYLCPVFWDASSNAYTYNSQPGTLTHEMSHFNDVAGTGDYQYGVPGCLQLASDSPNVAVDNADSHEFFQESHPVC